MGEVQSSSRLAYVISAMTLSVPILYLIGYFYQYGYLEEYNLSISLFGDSLEGYLVSAFVFFMQAFVIISTFLQEHPWSVLIFALGIWLYGLLIALVNRKKESIKSKAKKISKWEHFDIVIFPIGLAIASVSLPSMIFTFFAGAILGILFSWGVGHQVAQKEISNFPKCEGVSKCISISSKRGRIGQGRVVAATDKYLAIYDGIKVSIVPNNELTFETQPKK
ncbi:hypothetical protein ABMY44_16520 [Pseudoalteromonas sp. Cnat2-41]|uniref:hypothetical protein n=1 Tax=unclassified Pseudoalteromonas TaxID=194690 RepID=UPI001EF8B0B5|nr:MULTISPECIES: hypothetical protein [unclassified Pseudoalteromonas]MCF2862004.1 hypothetical protein [Pseudoalteromonas sp. CNAT2-18]MCG7559623.1 hypothetical protein [Pseudoalteromonas sp. CNAT2-18.1]